MHPTLQLQLLGDFRLSHGTAPVTSVRTPRLQSLLAYLALHGEAPQSRRYIAFRFWPDSTEKQARTNLRHLFHDLREALPEAERYLKADRNTLAWRRDTPCSIDVAEFRRAAVRAMEAMSREDRSVARSAFEEAAALYAGDLLPSCYDAWIEPAREHLRQAFTRVLDRLIPLLEEEREYRAAIHQARRLLRHDPVREATQRTLMRLHALGGDRAGAVRVYRECEAVLQRELDVEPGRVTRTLHQRILDEESPSIDPVTAHS